MAETVTRWSMFASVVDAQLNFDMSKEEFLAILRILHDYEAHQEYINEKGSLMGLMYEVQDVLWDHLSADWNLGWPAYEPPSEQPLSTPDPKPEVELRRSADADDLFKDLDG